jgi:uncharacterized protein (TIGR00730 family)
MKKQIVFRGPRIEEVLRMHPADVEPERMTKIVEEFSRGFHFLRNYKLAATIFGSARSGLKDETYQEAYKLGYALSKEGFAVITGGGPGIMEAANKGAYEAGGQSAGLNIQMETEQRINKYVQESEAFYYFFIRKVMLAFASEVYIFFPGGFGTLDEFFELVVLIQTKKIEPIPIILVNKAYWEPLLEWVEQELYEKRKAVGKNDMKLYHLADDADEALKLIKKMVVKTNSKHA